MRKPHNSSVNQSLLIYLVLYSIFHEMKRDYPTIKEYADAQNELGSCMPEFRSAVSKAVKFGASAGVPFGIYVAYRHHGWKLKPLAGKSVAVWFATTLTFGAIGVMAGTYCCLRVNM